MSVWRQKQLKVLWLDKITKDQVTPIATTAYMDFV